LEDGRFQVATNRDLVLRAKVVFIAGGAGAFVPRSPAIEGLSTLPPDDLQYALPERHTGLLQHKRHIVVLGDGDAALQAALVLGCEHGPHAKITLVHRRAVLSASAAVQGEFQAAIAAQSVNFIAAQLSGMRTDSGRLQSLNGVDANGAPIDIPCDHLLVLQGLSPKLGPIAAWGLDMERRQLTVDPETLATSEPGIYAVGDIISYPGKKKLPTTSRFAAIYQQQHAASKAFGCFVKPYNKRFFRAKQETKNALEISQFSKRPKISRYNLRLDSSIAQLVERRTVNP